MTRGSTSGRRMASAKPASTTRARRTRDRSGQDGDPEISPARWAGVALVMAALMGAIVLAVFSPSTPDSIAGVGPVVPASTQEPTPAASDGRVPTARPEIADPATGLLVGEWEIEVGVDVPKGEMARKELTLVVLRGDDPIGRMEKPKPRKRNVVAGVRLAEGLNVITAALEGPGGTLGPRSEPIEVTLDRSAPTLELTSPDGKTKTFEDTIEVIGTSVPGAEVRVINEAADYDSGVFVAGPNGGFDLDVPLVKGRNEIVAESTSEAGRQRDDKVVVNREDGKPKITIEAPESVARGKLPKAVKVVVLVTDASGDPMADASVSYSLQGVGRLAQTAEGETNDKGRSAWSVEIESGRTDPVTVAVSVTSPYDQTRTAKQTITID